MSARLVVTMAAGGRAVEVVSLAGALAWVRLHLPAGSEAWAAPAGEGWRVYPSREAREADRDGRAPWRAIAHVEPVEVAS
jgi:hypothetical protein